MRPNGKRPCSSVHAFSCVMLKSMLLLMLWPALAFAQVGLVLGDASVDAGDSGGVTSSISTDGSAVALQFDVLYDPAIVSLGTVSAGPALTASHTIASNPISAGRDRVVITTSPITAILPGVIANVAFAINAAAATGTTALNLGGVVISDDGGLAIAPASLIPGTITITGAVGPPPPPNTEPQAIPVNPVWSLLLLVGMLLLLVRRSKYRFRPSTVLPLFALSLLALSLPGQAQSIPGDANNDGIIDAQDVLLIVERILERGTLPGDGDCNRDQTINVLDTVCSQLAFVPGETDPIILGPGDRSIPAGVAFEMNLFAADPDAGSTLSWELVSGPVALTVSAAGVLSWTPGGGDLGGNAVSVRVTDNTARSSDADFTISVFTVAAAMAANAPPQLGVPSDQALVFDTTLAISAIGSDPDGDSFTFALVNAPTGMAINANSGAIDWVPTEAQIGLHDVAVSVTDTRGGTAFASFVVEVLNVSGAPVARDEVYEARLGAPLIVNAAGVLANDSDPDSDVLNAALLSYSGPGELTLNPDGSIQYLLEPPDRSTPVALELLCDNTRNPGSLGSPTAITSRYQADNTIAAGDVDNDGDVELVGTAAISGRSFQEEVWILNAADCTEQFNTGTAVEEAGAFSSTGHIGLHDIDGDGDLEIIGPRERYPDAAGGAFDNEHLIAIHHDGTFAWGVDGGSATSMVLTDNNSQRGYANTGPTFVDLDGDGTVEIVMASGITEGLNRFSAVIVYNAVDGSILWEYLTDERQGANTTVMPYVVDLDLDGTMEVIVHNSVIDHEGVLEFKLASEAPVGTTNVGHLQLGVGNFDDDAFPELVGRDYRNYYLFEHDGAIAWQFANRNSANSQIAVADFDADGEVEFADIGCTEWVFNCAEWAIQVFNADGSLLWDHSAQPDLHFDAVTQDGNNITAFDANRDGAMDLVIRNDGFGVNIIYIYDGRDGSVLAEIQAGPKTTMDQSFTTIADLNGDGHAEIVSSYADLTGQLEIWTGTAENPLPNAPSYRHQWNFQEAYVSDDLTIPSNPTPHWLRPGNNGYHTITPEPDPLVGADDSFTYVANDGALDSNQATVILDILPAGNPPQFLSDPDALTTRGFAYNYAPFVVDPDLGDVVTFRLTAAPAGMTINTSTGAVEWLPDSIGSYPVTILATDTIGFAVQQSWDLAVGEPVIVPDVVGLPEATAESDVTSANLIVGSTIGMNHPSIPAGSVYAQEPDAGSVAEFGARVRLFLSQGPGPLYTDNDGDGFSENQGDCDDQDNTRFPGATDSDGDGIDQDCDGIDGNKTLVAIELSPPSKQVLTNQPVPLIATGIFEDGTAQNLGAVAAWSNGPTFLQGSAGSYSPSASFRGITGSASMTVVDRVSEEVSPAAIIESPGNGDSVSAPVDIVGTATDANLLRWELAYQYAGEDEFVLLAEGSSQRVSGPIAEFDPTTLLNGLYTLRLRVYDRGGNVSEDTTTVQVEGQLKVGNFTLRYVDLELPLSGVPITLARTYDSRDKRVGDFGVGWRLGVNGIEIRTNRELGSAWRVFRQGLTYGLVEDDAHLAAIRLPDGRIEAFEMVVGPSVSPIVPFPPFSQSVSFRALPGTLGTLESLQDNNVSIIDPQPGPVTLRLDSNGDIYNPTLFRYTTSDGTTVDLDTRDGIQRAETSTGQVLTFTPASITHSNGAVLNIERDATGRISRITDPGGFSQSYAYDANGDLRTHIDQADFTTRFDYDSKHNIIRILDPLGRLVNRNEYDDSGRLIRTTNSDGRVVTFDHDIAGRQEIITDVDGSITVMEYDDRGNVLRVTDPLGNTTVNTYDVNDNQLTTTNALGETTTRTFDARNNPLTETDPLGNTTSFAYDARDNVISRQDALGRTVSYSYDARGKRVAEIDPLGYTTTFTYDADGNLIAATDELGNTKTYAYSDFGSPLSITDANGNTETFVYDANGKMTAETDRRGVSVTFDRDPRGLPAEGSDPAGRNLSFAWNATRVLSIVTDPAGNTTMLQTDADDKEIVFTDARGNRTEKQYDAKGNLSVLETPAGNRTLLAYDSLERLISNTLPDGARTLTRYDAAGRIVEQEDALGNVTRYEYDAAGRNTRVIDALGNATTYTYDAVGNMTRMTDANGGRFEHSYDAMNRRIRTTYPDGSFTQTGYDAIGQMISETDALGRVTLYGYDAIGNLIRVSDPLGGVTELTYDADDHLLTQIDARGHTTIFSYDAFGRRVSKTYPDGSTETSTYGAAGNLASQTDPNGDTTQYDYDASGLVTRKVFADGTSESYTYSVTDQMLTATNDLGTVRYEYDANDRLIGLENPDGSLIRYTYDGAGNRLTDTVQASASAIPLTTSYSYDALLRIETVTDPEGRITRYGYDPVGNLASIEYPNGVVSDYVYDANNRLRELTHRNSVEVIARYTYDVNALGDRTLVADSTDGSRVEYAYDELRRLVRESHYNIANSLFFDLRYEYDAVGNRTALIDLSGNVTSFSYDSADKLIAAGGTSYSYDANGNRLRRRSSGGETSYRFDQENQLVGVTTPSADIDYAYDAFGERVQRSAGVSESESYLVDPVSTTGYSQVLAEYDGDGVNAQYTFADKLLSRDDGAQARFYHGDASHNIRLLTDDTGAVTDSYDFSAFGDLIAATGGSDNVYGFASDRYDSSTSLTYLRARYYEPSTGRFVSRDPYEGRLRDPASLHRYLYANANPIMYTDPSGLFLGLSEVQVATVIGATIGGVSSGIAAYAAGKRGPALLAEVFIGAAFGAVGGAYGTALATAFAESKVIFALLRNPTVAKYGARLVYAIPVTAINLIEDLSKGVVSGDWRNDGYFRDLFLFTGANLFFNTFVGPGVVEAQEVRKIFSGAPTGFSSGEGMYEIFRGAAQRARQTRMASVITEFRLHTKQTLDEGTKNLCELLYQLTKILVSEAPKSAGPT